MCHRTAWKLDPSSGFSIPTQEVFHASEMIGDRHPHTPPDPLKKLRGSPPSRPGTRAVRPDLRQCQVSTPLPVVRFVWEQVRKRRNEVRSVLDLGAGDCRFALFAGEAQYTAYEVDAGKRPMIEIAKKVDLRYNCALEAEGQHDLVIGNPPFVRNQDIDPAWRERAIQFIKRETGESPTPLQNLYLYFLWISTIRAACNGMVALIVPIDWLYRPSAAAFRDYVARQGWGVEVFEFEDSEALFPTVETTICLALIDKAEVKGRWRFNETNLGPRGAAIMNASWPVMLEYAKRPERIYAGRSLSPGAQSAFVLTENERKRAGISRHEVARCVTTLRPMAERRRILDKSLFERAFVKAGRRCWLLRTWRKENSPATNRWISKVPDAVRRNYTCSGRDPWYRYSRPRIPDLIYAPGFSGSRPKILINAVRAMIVGSPNGVFGISNRAEADRIATAIRTHDFCDTTPSFSSGMQKLEVGQMNSFLSGLE